jgi:hypothetical protein
MINAKDLWKLLDDQDHHARALIAKNTELRSMLSQLNFPTDEGAYRCSCGFSFKTEARLAAHQQNVHGGPPLPLSPHEEKA